MCKKLLQGLMGGDSAGTAPAADPGAAVNKTATVKNTSTAITANDRASGAAIGTSIDDTKRKNAVPGLAL